MIMIRSLRWRLQIWHAVVLTVVLTTFGVVVSILTWQSHLQQVDRELDRLSGAVMSQMRRLIPPPPQFWRGRNPGKESDRGERRDVTVRRDDTSAAKSPRKEAEPSATDASVRGSTKGEPSSSSEAFVTTESTNLLRDRFGSGASIRLPQEFVTMFEGDDDSRPYFVIWDRDGKMLQGSEGAADIPFLGLKRNQSDLPVRIAQTRDGRREVAYATFFDWNLLVGRSLKKDFAERQTAWLWRCVIGVGVVSCGLVGGWWSSARAIRPLSEMSRTAASISAHNFSERIDLEDTDSELGQLALVLNQTFDRLEAAFDQQTRFTADASHELRTPLAVVLAQAELTLSRPRSVDDYRAALETCRRAGQRMKSLIECLLILARFDAGEPSLKLRPIELESLVHDCVDLLQPLATERQIAIECWMSPVSVVGDRERLNQVVTNLLTNAISYNRDGGRIDVTIEVECGQAILTVADTGLGISAEDALHVFERFYRVDKARSRADGGSGLGLAICKSIVEAHGGTISVRSTIEVGTTFEVRLPHRAELKEASSFNFPAMDSESDLSTSTQQSSSEDCLSVSHPASV